MFCVGGRHRTLVTDEVAALRPQVDADARLCSTEAQAAAASGLAHQAHGAVLGRAARDRRIHLVAHFRDAALAQEVLKKFFLGDREG